MILHIIRFPYVFNIDWLGGFIGYEYIDKKSLAEYTNKLGLHKPNNMGLIYHPQRLYRDTEVSWVIVCGAAARKYNLERQGK